MAISRTEEELRLRIHALEVFAAQLKVTAPSFLELMKEHGMVFDNLDDPMQKLAFTMYNDMVRTSIRAAELLDEHTESHTPKQGE